MSVILKFVIIGKPNYAAVVAFYSLKNKNFDLLNLDYQIFFLSWFYMTQF